MRRNQMSKTRAGVDASWVKRVRAGLNISESEFARSCTTARAELMMKALELESGGLPRAAIALGLIAIAPQWAASGPYAEPMKEILVFMLEHFPSGTTKLGDISMEYRN